jgi:hypothetical protein
MARISKTDRRKYHWSTRSKMFSSFQAACRNWRLTAQE